MMLKVKDRKPDFTGNRSFLQFWYVCVVGFFIAFCSAWYFSQLVISVVPDNSLKPIVFETFPGDKWSIEFTHSVEKTPVKEYFTVNAVNDLTMTHTEFESLGWGFPYSSTDGKFIKTADGKFRLIMNRPYKKIDLRIAVQAMPCIIHNKDIYNLYDFYGQGTAVTVKVQRRYQYLSECFYSF